MDRFGQAVNTLRESGHIQTRTPPSPGQDGGGKRAIYEARYFAITGRNDPPATATSGGAPPRQSDGMVVASCAEGSARCRIKVNHYDDPFAPYRLRQIPHANTLMCPDPKVRLDPWPKHGHPPTGPHLAPRPPNGPPPSPNPHTDHIRSPYTATDLCLLSASFLRTYESRRVAVFLFNLALYLYIDALQVSLTQLALWAHISFGASDLFAPCYALSCFPLQLPLFPSHVPPVPSIEH